MKAQLLMIVLLFSVISTVAVAQESSRSTIQELPEHPVFKHLAHLEKSIARKNVINSKINDNQLVRVEQQLWNENNWIPYSKTENVFELGRRVESTGYFKPDLTGDWVINSKEFYTYVDGMLTRVLLQGITDGVIVAEDLTTVDIQINGGVTTLVTTEQYRNEGMQEWGNLERSAIRSENGKITGGSYYEWYDDAWEEYERFTLEELNGDLVEITTYYDSFNEKWINDRQVIYPNLTIEELYDRVMEFTSQVDNGTLLFLVTLLPDFTEFQWMDEGESGSWLPVERQLTESSSELEFGATSAATTSIQTYDDTVSQWITIFSALVGYSDDLRPTGMSFYSLSDDSETVELQKIFSEEYQYNDNNLLAYILKYGSWDDFVFSKSISVEHASARSVLTWGDLNTSVAPGESAVSFRLNQAYPNPFNPSTVVPFQIGAASVVKIQVFDMLGRNVTTLVDDVMPAGNHTVRFDGSDLSSGVYLIRMIAPGLQQTRSVTLIK